MIYVKYLFIVFLCFTLVLCALIFWASYSPLKQGSSSQLFITDKNSNKKNSMNTNGLDKYDDNFQELKIMSWNLAFAYGEGSEGKNYQKLNRAQMLDRIEGAANVIKKYSADIVFIQEIDFDSDRSHNIDQLEYIAKKAGYKNYAYAVSWQHNYLPFPYFPIKNQWAKIKSGGAILSRFPILSNQVYLYAKPKANPFWYNIFYLYRYCQAVTIEYDGNKIGLINNHLEAFDKITRQEQAHKLVEKIKDQYQNNMVNLIVAGDFNTTPPSARNKDKFEDLGKNNYLEDSTYNKISTLPFIKEIVSEKEYQQEESKWFTFSSTRPDRRLDYIFVTNQFKVIHKEIDKNQVSDHFPVITTLRYIPH